MDQSVTFLASLPLQQLRHFLIDPTDSLLYTNSVVGCPPYNLARGTLNDKKV